MKLKLELTKREIAALNYAWMILWTTAEELAEAERKKLELACTLIEQLTEKEQTP